MKVSFDEQKTWNFEKCFGEADTAGKNVLTKEQMRKFLLRCLEEGIFAEFYAKKDDELNIAVEGLFEEYFAEAYAQSSTPDCLDRNQVAALIQVKFADDVNLQNELMNELDKN